MYNLQAIISKGTNNALVQFERFGQIAIIWQMFKLMDIKKLLLNKY